MEENSKRPEFVFNKTNYILMVIGIVLLIIGYILLSGGGSDDPTIFNESMFNTRRMYIAPILIVLGFIIEIIAIMIKTGTRNNKSE